MADLNQTTRNINQAPKLPILRHESLNQTPSMQLQE